MKARLEFYIEKYFPGMGLRPFYLTVLSGVLLITYYYQGRIAPAWFVHHALQFTGIDDARFQWFLWFDLSAFIILLIIPLIILKLTEGWKPSDLGLGIAHIKKGILEVEILWLWMLPVLWYAASTPESQKMYPFLKSAETNMMLFFYFELAFLIQFIAWEFFFRGFMLFAFMKDMGHKAVLISTLVFAIAHFGKPESETLGAIIAGFILCAIALRNNSIWPGVLLHWQIAMSMDFFTSPWWR